MKLKDRISAFICLGKILLEAAGDNPQSTQAAGFREIMERQQSLNRWFTPDNVRMAVKAIGSVLTPDSISKWISKYDIQDSIENPLEIGVIMAGNIPLVGFNDFLNVLISGHRIKAKSSSKDSQLIGGITAILTECEPRFSDYIDIDRELPANIDAVIATGSDNTSRYFEYYFGNKPHLFRKNRTSISIITPGTNDRDIKLMGNDIFSYFGMGCRNVSKIFVCEDFDLRRLSHIWKNWDHLASHYGWKNNYEYNRALLQVNREKFIDGDFFLLINSLQTVSPLSVIHYEYYTDLARVERSITENSEKIQCVTGDGNIPHGRAQQPELCDYADNVDTMKFLLSLK